jgi:hypothetical protein
MFDYYFRCLETDYEDLLVFCEKSGLIKRDKTDIYVIGRGTWDAIGKVYDKNSGREEVSVKGEISKVEQVYLSKGAVPYVHVNLRTEVDITKIVTQDELNKFFYVDLEGKMTAPEIPLRVFL